MQVAHLSAVITPEPGVFLAGYGANDTALYKHDELMLHGICLRSRGKKVLLLSYDLIGLARELVVEIRRGCAELLGGSEADVLLSCTHTHGGPQTRHPRGGRIDDASCRRQLSRQGRLE